MPVKVGLEKFFDRVYPQKFAGKKLKIGVLSNSSAVDSNYCLLLDRLRDETDFKIHKIFAPEHGIFSVLQDMIPEKNKRNSPWGKQILSLYGKDQKSLKPKEDWLKGLDLIIFDIQDVGSRYYTYLCSMVFTMQACSGKDIQFWVLDRPNPIGLDNVENTPLLDKNFSFVGSLPIANRHGLTAGEYALFAKKHLGLDIDLQIARYSGRGAFPWVFPSPNMPTIQTALVYPGQCLFEATELSEGRGCTRPFELFGAPYINPWKIQDELKSIDLPGVAFRPLYFQPTFQKHAGKVCGGFQIHVSNAKIFKPLLTSLCLMWLIKNCYPDQFKWREKPYEFIEDIPAIDLLVGHDHFRETLDSGQDLLTCLDASCYSEHQFIDSEFFLYPRKWS